MTSREKVLYCAARSTAFLSYLPSTWVAIRYTFIMMMYPSIIRASFNSRLDNEHFDSEIINIEVEGALMKRWEKARLVML